MENERRNFDQEAAVWEEKPERVKIAKNVSQSMLKTIPFDSSMHVLDFGCGTGLISLAIQPHVQTITGIDTSQGMLKVFQNKVDTQHLLNVKIRYLDLEHEDTLSEKFHVIVSSMTLHHVPDTQKILDKFYQLLEPKGILALADLDREDGLFHQDNHGVFHHGFDRTALSHLFEKAGFRNTQVQTAAETMRSVPNQDQRKFTIFLISGWK
jgi:2-polyprenyl-3-methyl-5-hydroxy-6-metoxy-1,4-benzoquinol methylase